jgi:acyl-CoA thioesterase YciA
VNHAQDARATWNSIYDLPFTIYYPFMNSDPAIRITMLPRDTNSQGTIFGGVILSYIDMAGAIEAHRRTGMDRFVTVAMREVIFHQPVFVGDLVSFYSETIKIGTTSITTRVVVEAERYGSPGKKARVTEAEVVYVAVDANGKKIRIRNDQQ